MNANPSYRKYHPKSYRKRIPILWWTRKRAHIKIILREFTSVFVAFYAIMLLIQISAISRGSDSYDAFLQWLQTPGSLILHFIAFFISTFSTVSRGSVLPRKQWSCVWAIKPFQMPQSRHCITLHGLSYRQSLL